MQELIDNCKKNKKEAQRELYERYKTKLFGICLTYTKNKEEAEDILQDAFIKILEKIGQYSGKGNFEGWMRRIVVNEALAHHRKRGRLKLDEEELQQTIYCTKEDIDTTDHSKRALELIRQLPIGYQTVFNLRAIEEYSFKEIAQEMNIKESTARSQFVRAKEQLKKMLIPVLV
ncbi:MAG: RNA polymerase sigma factor [Flavobacteriales bacterium]|nr:RNA polymerase sigma factor [Flavobacteriales bacterium]